MGTPRELFPANYGYSLWGVFAAWILVLAILYPLCLWYSRLKQRRRDWWLSYL
jgi:ABC-type spermidine/putrescine transport system permease subunit I